MRRWLWIPWVRRFIGWMFEHMSFAIPVKRLRETETLMAFHHPKPSYPFHVLLVPKKAVVSLKELDPKTHLPHRFVFHRQSLVEEFHLPAYRLIVNGGEYQDFPQLHFHLISDVEGQSNVYVTFEPLTFDRIIMDSIAILDFGSQYAQIIARRVREAQVYCELFPWDAPAEKILSIAPKGFILSGGPKSVYEEGAPYIQDFILKSGLPILGICYGMQALTHALGGQVDPSASREYGQAEIEPLLSTPLLSTLSLVWMSHGDRITRLPQGFVALARSGNSPYAAMGDLQRKYFGVQFHPEVHHTPNGEKLLQHFVLDICEARPEWTPRSIIDEVGGTGPQQVGKERVLAAVSGGVDSSVAAALVHEAIGDQLVAVFVDTGLLRKNEGEQVAAAFRNQFAF